MGKSDYPDPNPGIYILHTDGFLKIKDKGNWKPKPKSCMRSLLAFLAGAVIILYAATLFYPKWENQAGESSFGYDAFTYYGYLPAAFIYKDLKKQRFVDSIMDKYRFIPNHKPFVHEKSGNPVFTYSSGLALVYLPAFALAHVLAEPLGFPADGFSLPYQVIIQFWSILGVLVGLWYYRKLLRRYFSDSTAAWLLILLVFGTNFLNYTGIDVTLTHSWLFSFFVGLMLASDQYYRNPSYGYAAAMGIISGLCILIRPSEILVAVIPLFWGMGQVSLAAFRQRFQFLRRHISHLLLAFVLVLLIGSIQVAYWLYVTGEPLVYSYDDKGFSWLSPHFYLYTFSYRSGWLVYTPLMFFVFWAMLIHAKRGENRVALLGFFLLNYYVVSAWDIWWYGGMGGRAMVQSYAMAFMIIGSWWEWLKSTSAWIKGISYVLMALFAYVNIWFTYNAHAGQGLYDPSGMTSAYYWAVVGRSHVPEYTAIFKDTEEYFTGKPKDLRKLHALGMDPEGEPVVDCPNPASRKIVVPIQEDWVKKLDPREPFGQ